MIGDRDFGMAGTKWGEANMHARHIEWFNHWLKKEPLPASAPVNYFVMGLNDWKTAENWPPQNANMTPLYFKNEKVSAEFTPPTTSSEAKFSYDPENPVPSNGGGTLHKALNADGPRDQQQIELREDVLCYSTEPLKEAIEVTGSIQVKLWAKSDAPNTDFTAKLVDVFPDGTAFNLADGIIRAAKQHGDNVQNNINEYTIDLWATSNLFQKVIKSALKYLLVIFRDLIQTQIQAITLLIPLKAKSPTRRFIIVLNFHHIFFCQSFARNFGFLGEKFYIRHY